MRRVLFAIMGTIAGLVGLLSFKTHSTSLAASTSIAATGPVDAAGGSSSGSESSGSESSGSSGSSGNSTSGTGTTSASSTKKSATPTTNKAATSSTKNSAKNSAKSSAPSTKTVTGPVVETQYGPIQVRIRVTNGKIANATVVQYPNQDPRSQQISYYAIPVLERESVAQSSANIDMVSGATYTSEGYLQSLQSALNKAGL